VQNVQNYPAVAILINVMPVVELGVMVVIVIAHLQLRNLLQLEDRVQLQDQPAMCLVPQIFTVKQQMMDVLNVAPHLTHV
jgi:hypothetical protein